MPDSAPIHEAVPAVITVEKPRFSWWWVVIAVELFLLVGITRGLNAKPEFEQRRNELARNSVWTGNGLHVAWDAAWIDKPPGPQEEHPRPFDEFSPLLWFWPYDAEHRLAPLRWDPRKLKYIREDGSGYNSRSMEIPDLTPTIGRDEFVPIPLSPLGIGNTLLAPMQGAMSISGHLAPDFAQTLDDAGLAPLLTAVARLQERFGPIYYFRGKNGKSVSVEFAVEGERYRTDLLVDRARLPGQPTMVSMSFGEPAPLTEPRDPDSPEFWCELTPSLFPNVPPGESPLEEDEPW